MLSKEVTSELNTNIFFNTFQSLYSLLGITVTCMYSDNVSMYWCEISLAKNNVTDQIKISG